MILNLFFKKNLIWEGLIWRPKDLGQHSKTIGKPNCIAQRKRGGGGSKERECWWHIPRGIIFGKHSKVQTPMHASFNESSQRIYGDKW